MNQVAAIPIHDPDGIMFSHFTRITPLLKQLFSQVFLGVSVATQHNRPEDILSLEADSFFQVMRHQSENIVGQDFMALYGRAAASCHPDQIVHLCFTDRVAYALLSEYQAAFMADVQSLKPQDTPLIFERSELAWRTRPQNYRKIEQMVTTAGELLFGKTLDFAWCHIAIQAGRLMEIVPKVKNHDMSFFAEIVLAIRDEAKTKHVDWLSWEDPLINSIDPQVLKSARESSVNETNKRLGYVIPMLQLLVEVGDDN